MACWAHGWPKIFKVQQSSESPVATDAEKKIAELGLLACKLCRKGRLGLSGSVLHASRPSLEGTGAMSEKCAPGFLFAVRHSHVLRMTFRIAGPA